MRGIIALLIRSLREDTRSVRPHLLRGALIGMVLIMLHTVVIESRVFGAPGHYFFVSVLYVDFVFISLAGISYFASAITEEKEERTLGLLRMAGMNPLALLLGKSFPRLLLAIVLLSVQFPFTLLAITLGGVTLHQVAAGYVSLLSYTFLLSNLALLYSVISRRTLGAAVAMGTTVVFLFFFSRLVDQAQSYLDYYVSHDPRLSELLNTVADALRGLSIYSQLTSVGATGFAAPVFGTHFVMNTLVGLLSFFTAWLVFDRYAGAEADASASKVTMKLRNMRLVRPGRIREHLLGPGAAMVWKDFNFLAGGRTMWLAKLIGYPVLMVAILFMVDPGFNSSLDSEEIGGFMCSMMLFFAGTELTIQFGRTLSEEHSGKTLPLLALLPQSTSGILYPKVLGCIFGLAPAALYFFIGLVLMGDELFDFMGDIVDDPDEFFGFTYFCVLVVLFMHLTMFISTYTKWGSGPLAFGILFAFNMCCLSTIFSTSSSRDTATAVFFMLSAIGSFVIVVVHLAIGRRFRELASR